MEKFHGVYRVPSTRLPAWDYATNAAYFVTICTLNRLPYFGKIDDQGRMLLTPIGQSAAQGWAEIPIHFPDASVVIAVVMPNHAHGIILLHKDEETLKTETQDFASLPKNRFGPQSRNLASIVRGYKIGVTKYARSHQIPFAWQPGYHDHIIHDPQEFATIYDYIQSNPQKWADDTYFNSSNNLR